VVRETGRCAAFVKYPIMGELQALTVLARSQRCITIETQPIKQQFTRSIRIMAAFAELTVSCSFAGGSISRRVLTHVEK
jgi:hypothetical protein